MMFANILFVLALAIILRVLFHMPINDVVNGALECFGGLFVFLSIQHVRAAGAVAGVSWKHVAFFTVWGFWNVWFYANEGFWFSWVGGVFLVVMQAIWLGLIFYYLVNGKRILSPVTGGI